jgi:hypothetical protein
MIIDADVCHLRWMMLIGAVDAMLLMMMIDDD